MVLKAIELEYELHPLAIIRQNGATSGTEIYVRSGYSSKQRLTVASRLLQFCVRKAFQLGREQGLDLIGPGADIGRVMMFLFEVLIGLRVVIWGEYSCLLPGHRVKKQHILRNSTVLKPPMALKVTSEVIFAIKLEICSLNGARPSTFC